MATLDDVTPDRDQRRELAWKAVSTLSAVLGGLLARKVLAAAWTTIRADTEPPGNPADRRVRWPDALMWAVATGVGIGVARLVTKRLAAAGWELTTGAEPPGLDTRA